MKYVFQFLRIIGVCFIGEVLAEALPLPIPASVYGLVLMLVMLRTGLYRLEQVRETGMFFVSILTIFFIPAAVGVMEQWDVLVAIIFPCVIATLLITALVMGVTGRFTQWIHRFGDKGKNSRGPDTDCDIAPEEDDTLTEHE